MIYRVGDAHKLKRLLEQNMTDRIQVIDLSGHCGLGVTIVISKEGEHFRSMVTFDPPVPQTAFVPCDTAREALDQAHLLVYGYFNVRSPDTRGEILKARVRGPERFVTIAELEGLLDLDVEEAA